MILDHSAVTLLGNWIMCYFLIVFFFFLIVSIIVHHIYRVSSPRREITIFLTIQMKQKFKQFFFAISFFIFFFLNSHLLIHQHTVNFLLYSPKFRRKCRLLSARPPDSRIRTVVASLRNVWNRRMADRLIRLDAGYREFQHNFRTNRIISSFEG